MNQRALVVAAGLFIVIIGSMFGYAYMKRAQLAEQAMTPPIDLPSQTEEAVRVNAVHFFADGKHTVVGDIMMQTPCDLLQSDAVVRESSPEQVGITLTTVNNADVCAQVLTLQRFRVDFTASKEAQISATLNGKPAVLNLKDAEPGQEPDKLEDLYFKG